MKPSRTYYFIGKELTLDILKSMEPGLIFAEGYCFDDRLNHDFDLHWVAKRGEIHDWAIYYHKAELSTSEVAECGDKSFTKEVIRELAPCTDEAFEMYRF
jgi:hypothetical protein